VCWGCGLEVTATQALTLEKCVYCGALLAQEASAGANRPRRVSRPRGGRVVMLVGDFLQEVVDGADSLLELASMPVVRRACSAGMVVFVLALTMFIVALGVVYVYPSFLPPPPAASFYGHWAVCLCLLSNTLLNYLFSVLQDPGFIERRDVGSMELVSAGSLNNHTFCWRCNAPKPASCHHCRVCRRCVMDMDHHCPFIGNCVGAGNRREFVLFLFWTACSMLYVVGVSGALCIAKYDEIEEHVVRTMKALPPIDMTNVADYFELAFARESRGVPLRSAFVLVILGCVVFLFTSTLLIGQLQDLVRGETIISRVKRTGRRRAEQTTRLGASMANCRAVFGTGPVWTWLLPRKLSTWLGGTTPGGSDTVGSRGAAAAKEF